MNLITNSPHTSRYMKKDDLIKENARLMAEVEALNREDETRRKELSALLNSYDLYVDKWTGRKDKAVAVQSWLGIAFLIGELKADADYSCVLEARENFRRENEELHREIKDLKNPPSPLPH